MDIAEAKFWNDVFVNGLGSCEIGGDGEELDVYLLGVNEPVESFTGRIIGIAHRVDDVEDKLIMAPPDMNFTREEVERAVHFQEQYYDTHIELVK